VWNAIIDSTNCSVLLCSALFPCESFVLHVAINIQSSKVVFGVVFERVLVDVVVSTEI
jgi:hypothetical protein